MRMTGAKGPNTLALYNYAHELPPTNDKKRTQEEMKRMRYEYNK